jgi:hypothetical protein
MNIHFKGMKDKNVKQVLFEAGTSVKGRVNEEGEEG